MNKGIISTRYAKALMMAGADNRCLDALKADMELLKAVMKETPVFAQILDNPVIKPSQKRKVIAELLAQQVHPMTINFVNTLIRNRRELLMADVVRDFIDLYEKSKGIRRAHVVAATGMDEQAREQLQQQLNTLLKANVQLTVEENPELIGGFILRAGDRQYDASLSSALKRMKKKMTEN